MSELKELGLSRYIFGYGFDYPALIFSENEVPSMEEEKSIENILKNRNPYYVLFPKRRNLLIERIISLSRIIEFIRGKISEMVPNRHIVSIYTCGSYIYSSKFYIPNDIDIAIVVEGSMFEYLPKIKIPRSIYRNLVMPVKYLSLNFYGRDNFERGILLGDEISEKDIEIMREASIGYLRNVVIYGKDFLPIKYPSQNTYAAKFEMLVRCKLRLEGRGRYGEESDKERLEKLACRICSLNVFLKFFHSDFSVNMKNVLMLPELAQQGKFGYRGAKMWYNRTVNNFNKLKNIYERDRT